MSFHHGQLVGFWSGDSGFPVVIGTPALTTSTGVTSLAVNLPSGIQAGELLIMCINQFNNGRDAASVGWTVSINGAAATVAQMLVLTKVATGSEGATATVTWPSSPSQTDIITIRVTNWKGAIATGFSGATVTAGDNPPNLAPGWGSANILWFAFDGQRANPAAASVPTGYTLVSQAVNLRATLGKKAAYAASEDPATFTITTGNTPICVTFAVRPA